MVTKYLKAGISHASQGVVVSVASIGATAGLFTLLPLINAMAGGDEPDTRILSVDSVELPPPPDVVEEEQSEPEEEEPEETPLELEQESEPLDLAQLEMLMADDFGAGLGGATIKFDIDISKVTGGGGVESLFDLSDLDSKPIAIDQQVPSLKSSEKRATPGRVIVIFIVDSSGRVKSPKVQSSSHPALEAAALRAVKKWRFKAATREGRPVATRSRQVIDFPKQS